MGLMDASCCLSPTGSSLKGYGSGPSSSQPLTYCPHFNMSAAKSQMFFPKEPRFHVMPKAQPLQIRKMYNITIDKWHGLWFNDTCTQDKDFDGKFASVQKLQRAGGWCEPVWRMLAIWFPSRFCKRAFASVMEPGCPRYRDRTCWSLKGFPFMEIIRVVPRIL